MTVILGAVLLVLGLLTIATARWFQVWFPRRDAASDRWRIEFRSARDFTRRLGLVEVAVGAAVIAYAALV